MQNDAMMPARYSTGDSLLLPVAAQRLLQPRLRPLLAKDHRLQDVPAERRHHQHDAVDGGRHGPEMVLAHPAGREREQRQPEQQVQVGPQHAAGHVGGRVQQVVVVVPVDADVDEAQHVAQEHRPQLRDRGQVVAVGHVQLQHHDRDDDGQHAIAERLESTLAHLASARRNAAPRSILAAARPTPGNAPLASRISAPPVRAARPIPCAPWSPLPAPSPAPDVGVEG